MKIFSIEPKKDKIKITFSSSLFYVNKVVDEIFNFFTGNKIPFNPFELNLILHEALNNAVVHGNSCDLNKTNIINVHIDDKKIDITIWDQGTGFDLEKKLKRKQTVNQTSGRGFFIIQSYGFNIHYDNQLNCMSIKKNK